MPSKKPSALSRRPVTREDAALERTERVTIALGRRARSIMAACVMAGGILVAARQQSQPLLTTTPRHGRGADAGPAGEEASWHRTTAHTPPRSGPASSASRRRPRR